MSLDKQEQQLEASSLPRLQSSHVTYDCQIKVETNKTDFYLDTGYTELDPNLNRCYQFLNSAVSLSGNYVAYRDIGGGVDLKLILFSIKDFQTYTVGVYGTSNLLSFAWAEGDRLVVLNGYKQIPQEQYLFYLDLSEIVADDGYLQNNQHDLSLPKSDSGYLSIFIEDEIVNLYSGSRVAATVSLKD